FTRVITDGTPRFDEIKSGYRGPLYLEVSPQSFPVRVYAGLSLNQLRLLEGPTSMSDAGLATLYRQTPLLYDDDDRPLTIERVVFNDGLCMGIDLSGRTTGGVIGYRAHPNPPAVDLARVAHYDPSEFWEPIKAPVHDGQTSFKVWFERLRGRPERVYGVGLGSSYQHQTLSLSKHFRR